MDPLMSVREAAILAGTSKDTIRRRIKDGVIPAEPFLGDEGSDWVIRADEWAEYLESHNAPGQARRVRAWIETHKSGAARELIPA